jgi:hypothetical protein
MLTIVWPVRLNNRHDVSHAPFEAFVARGQVYPRPERAFAEQFQRGVASRREDAPFEIVARHAVHGLEPQVAHLHLRDVIVAAVAVQAKHSEAAGLPCRREPQLDVVRLLVVARLFAAALAHASKEYVYTR